MVNHLNLISHGLQDEIELVRNKCYVTNHQVNVQLLLQLQPGMQVFVNCYAESRAEESNQDNSPELTEELGMIIQRAINVVRAGKIVGTPVSARSWDSVLQLCKDMGMFQGGKLGIRLNAEQADWKDDTMVMSDRTGIGSTLYVQATTSVVTPDSVWDTSGPFFDV
ncbi:hypothetical protein Tco_0631610 [Tanacetum coccineum]